MRTTISEILKWTGMLLILAGMVIPLFTGPQHLVYKCIFSAGALFNFVGRLMTDTEYKDMRVKRLLRLETWSGLFFGVAAYFMFTDPNPKNWIVFVLAGAAILTYTSIMIPLARKKATKK